MYTVISKSLAQRIQLVGLISSLVLGLIAGGMFAAGHPQAWSATYTLFLWLLILGLLVSAAGYLAGRAQGLREGLLLSGSIFLAQTSVFLVSLLLLSMLAPIAVPISADAPPHPLAAIPRLATMCYSSASAMTMFGAVFYRRVIPSQHR